MQWALLITIIVMYTIIVYIRILTYMAFPQVTLLITLKFSCCQKKTPSVQFKFILWQLLCAHHCFLMAIVILNVKQCTVLLSSNKRETHLVFYFKKGIILLRHLLSVCPQVLWHKKLYTQTHPYMYRNAIRNISIFF